METYLRENVPIADKVEAILVSPVSRTIDTALLGLDWLIKRGVPVSLDPYWIENSDNGCDTPSSKERLAEMYPQFHLTETPPEYPQKTGVLAFTQDAIEARGRHVRQALKNRPEKVIAVVSHAAFLRLGATHWRFANADYRIFDFATEGDELVQWQDTEEKGGGMGRSAKERSYPKPIDFQNTFDPEKFRAQSAAQGNVVDDAPTR